MLAPFVLMLFMQVQPDDCKGQQKSCHQSQSATKPIPPQSAKETPPKARPANAKPLIGAKQRMHNSNPTK